MHTTLTGFDKKLAIINHHHALLGTFFLSLEIEPEYLSVTTNIPDVCDWEYTLPFQMLESEDHHKSHIYTNQMLTQPDLILRFQDSWLVRSIADCEEKALTDFRIVEVKDALDMQTFINGFSQAYFEIEKTQLDHYCHALLNAYHDKQAKLVYFYILDNYHNLVGVSAIAMIEPYSFSYCIGVIPAFRGKKISTLLLDHHSQYAKKEGCNFQVLQTEANSFVENIYMKNNFTLFETMRFYQYNPHP